jgi:hypothetical protein
MKTLREIALLLEETSEPISLKDLGEQTGFFDISLRDLGEHLTDIPRKRRRKSLSKSIGSSRRKSQNPLLC